MRLRLWVLLCVALCGVQSAKILFVAPRFGRSHVVYVGNIADIMVEAGHKAVMLIYAMDERLTTNGTKLAKTIVIPRSPAAKKFYEASTFENDNWALESTSVLVQYEQLVKMTDMFAGSCLHASSQHQLLDTLKSAKFDLAVAELFDACAFGLIEYLEIPAHVTVASSMLLDGMATLFGVPRMLSYVPSTFSTCSDQMSYTERISNVIGGRVAQMFQDMVTTKEQRVFRKVFGTNFIDIKEKIAESAFMLVNTNPLYDFPGPTISKIVQVGGFTVETPKKLDEKWSEVMKLRPKAVLVSFGSVAKSSMMPAEMKTTLLKTFANFPTVTFIWKYEKAENIAKDFPNVVVADWVPQNDLLNDDRVVAYVTHGGVNSLHEAIRSGTPMLVFPLFGDQMHNGRMVERAGVAVVLDKTVLYSENQLTKEVSRILNNDSYTQAARLLSRMVKMQPIDPKQSIIRHLEFAAEFGKLPLMDNLGRKMPTYKYLLLDIFIPLAIVCLLLVALVIYLAYRASRCLFDRYAKTHKTSPKKPKTQ